MTYKITRKLLVCAKTKDIALRYIWWNCTPGQPYIFIENNHMLARYNDCIVWFIDGWWHKKGWDLIETPEIIKIYNHEAYYIKKDLYFTDLIRTLTRRPLL